MVCCGPNPNSYECSQAHTEYVSAKVRASISRLSGEMANESAIQLAEFDAIQACGERGFLEKEAKHAAEVQKIMKDF